MKSTMLRGGLALAAILAASEAADIWLPGSSRLVQPAVAQMFPATLPSAAVAPQAPQLRPPSGSTTAGQAARGMPNQMFNGAPRPGANAAAANTGTLLQGDERFLRRNRRPGSFVGNDSQEGRDFVGATRGGNKDQVGSGADGLPLARGSAGNSGADGAARAARINPPRWAVAFDVPGGRAAAVSEVLTRQLAAIPGLHPQNQIAVSVAGSVATLRGVVASVRDRSLAEQLVLFEPGIATVRNDLQVQSFPPNPQPPRPSGSLPARSPASEVPAGSAARQ